MCGLTGGRGVEIVFSGKVDGKEEDYNHLSGPKGRLVATFGGEGCPPSLWREERTGDAAQPSGTLGGNQTTPPPQRQTDSTKEGKKHHPPPAVGWHAKSRGHGHGRGWGGQHDPRRQGGSLPWVLPERRRTALQQRKGSGWGGGFVGIYGPEQRLWKII